MKTIKELGKKIKAECPGWYDHLSDEEVGWRVKVKYPERFADYGDVTPETPANIQAVIDYYRPERGRFTSWWQRGKTESRNRLLNALNEEQRLVIERGAVLEKAAKESDRAAIEFQVFLAQNAQTLLQLKHTASLMEQALESGLTLETDQEVKKARLLSDITIDEHKRRTAIDLEIRWKEIVQDLDGADLVEMSAHQILAKERQYLAEQVRDKHRLLTGNDPQEVKDELIADYDQHIRFLKERIHARQAQLLLSENGKEIGRITAGQTNATDLSQETTQGTQE